VIRRVLDLLAKIATERADEYLAFWGKFGPVLKEGLHLDPTYTDKIAPLLRYESSGDHGLSSLAEYVKRMPEGQSKIYYALGSSKALLQISPHLETLKKRGYEVLFMTHGIDQWAIEGLREFDGKKLVDAMQESNALDDDSADADKPAAEQAQVKEAKEAAGKALEGLLARAKTVLESQVSDVRISERLTDSPACLVVPRGGLPAHIERLLRAHQEDLPEQKRILELNPDHPLILRMKDELIAHGDSALLTEWIELLYDQALLVEGSPLPDPARFSRRLVALMQSAPSVIPAA
jgi:molecular chaperone HtpG